MQLANGSSDKSEMAWEIWKALRAGGRAFRRWDKKMVSSGGKRGLALSGEHTDTSGVAGVSESPKASQEAE